MQFKGVVGAPDYVLEVLPESTRTRDLGIKADKYREKGVREYWALDIKRNKLIVYDYAGSDITRIYGLVETVPVAIYDGKLTIDMDRVCRNARRFMT